MSRSFDRKGLGKILLMVFVLCGFDHTAMAETLPDAEQVERFLAAVWKDKPNSVDATVYRTITKPPKSEQQLREEVEETFAKDKTRTMERYKSNARHRQIMLDKLNRMIEMNIEIRLNKQKTPRRIKERIRISNGRERHDLAYADTPEVLLGPNTPYETSTVDLGKRTGGEIRCFEYDHEREEAKIHTGGWAPSRIEDFTGLPHVITGGWQGLLGKRTAPGLYMPDPDKINKFKSTYMYVVSKNETKRSLN